MRLVSRRAQARRRSYTLTAYDNLVLADNPVAYWSPDGSQARDLTGNGHNAAAVGAPTAASLPNGAGPAVVFDGTTKYLEIPDSDALSVPATGILTAEAWMRPDVLEFTAQEGSGYVYWMGKGEPNQHEWAARMYSTTNSEVPPRPNRISGYAFNLSGGLGTGSYFQDAITAGVWIHYTLVINTVAASTAYPHGYAKLYRDGIQRDQDDLYATVAVIPGNGTAPMRIGTRDLGSFFQGAIGKVAIYDYEVPQARLLAHVRSVVPPPGAGTGSFVKTLGAAQSVTSGTTLVIPVPAGGVPVGDTVIIEVAHDYTSGGPTCVDSRGNVYTRDRTAANTGTTMRASLWSAPITTALLAGDVITITTSAAVVNKVATASQFTGIIAAARIDQANGGSGTSTTPSAAAGITTTVGNDVLVAMCAVRGPDTDAYTEDVVQGIYNGTARVGTETGTMTLSSAFRSVASTGTYNYRPTLGTSRDWLDFLIAYKAG